MGLTFTSVKGLEKYLQAQIDSVLLTEITEEATKTAIAHAHRNVYDAYWNQYTFEPNIYERRYEKGGLIDPKNFEGKLVDTGTLEFRSIVQPQKKPEWDNVVHNLSELIEFGHSSRGGNYKYPKGKDTYGYFKPPRPFIGPTADTLSRPNVLKHYFVKGLKRRRWLNVI